MQLVTAIMLLGLGQVVHPGIIHQWSAEGDAADNVGNADGVLNGDISFADGVWGQAFDFNGGHVDFGNIANFGQSDWSVTLWLQIDNYDDHVWRAIVGKRGECAASSFWEIRKLYWENKLHGITCQPIACTNEVSSPIGDDEWHHVALIREDCNLRLYFDGIMNDSNCSDMGVIDNNAHMIAGTNICQEILIGRIDELQIYNRALSQVEMEELADADTDQDPPCPADFNDDDNVGAEDLAVLLGFWGMNDPMFGDVDNDGDVDATDLALLLGSWGPC